MTVLLSALSRYHVFDLALQLQRNKKLAGLVTAYPRFALGRYGSLSDHLISLPSFALARESVIRTDRLNLTHLSSFLAERTYSSWSTRYANIALEANSKVIYGLSGYMYEALDSLAGKGRLTVVDHGSLHIDSERTILERECAEFGFMPFGNWQHPWLVKRMREEFKQADYVVCCSNLAKETLMNNGVREENIVVRRLGVDLMQFRQQSGRSLGDARRATEAIRLLFVGSITPLKGVHRLLDAFCSLEADVELTLIGVLPTDRRLKEKIEAAVAKTKRVRVLPPVAQDKLKEVYWDHDLFVMPSLCDGWGMVVNQALACGLPVVVSDMAGAKECITDGVNGFVYESQSPDGLLEALYKGARLVKSRRNEMDTQATYLEATHTVRTWDQYGQEWSEWLDELCVP